MIATKKEVQSLVEAFKEALDVVVEKGVPPSVVKITTEWGADMGGPATMVYDSRVPKWIGRVYLTGAYWETGPGNLDGTDTAGSSPASVAEKLGTELSWIAERNERTIAETLLEDAVEEAVAKGARKEALSKVLKDLMKKVGGEG